MLKNEIEKKTGQTKCTGLKKNQVRMLNRTSLPNL
jgi:hypothetical protein